MLVDEVPVGAVRTRTVQCVRNYRVYATTLLVFDLHDQRIFGFDPVIHGLTASPFQPFTLFIVEHHVSMLILYILSLVGIRL